MSEDDRDSAGRDGFEAGLDRSEGNPWVVHGLNAVLSTMFALTIVWGLDFVDMMEFTPVNVATVAVVIFAAGYLMAVR